MGADLAESRRKYCEALTEQTSQLIIHFSDRSLQPWQLGDIRDWIERNLSTLASHKAGTLEVLSRQYHDACVSRLTKVEQQLLQNELNMTVDELVTAVEAGQFGSLSKASILNSVFQQPPSKDDMRYTRTAGEKPGQSRFDKNKEQSVHTSNGSVAKTINKQLLEKLFRRTAQVLHPDHEQDPQIRDHKHQLMKTLLTARKDGNISVVIELYQKYVDTSGCGFEIPDLKSLVALLQRQIQRYDREYHEMVDHSPTNQWVHQNVMQQGGLTLTEALEKLQQDFVVKLREVSRVAPYLQSLQALKAVLSRGR